MLINEIAIANKTVISNLTHFLSDCMLGIMMGIITHHPQSIRCYKFYLIALAIRVIVLRHLVISKHLVAYISTTEVYFLSSVLHATILATRHYGLTKLARYKLHIYYYVMSLCIVSALYILMVLAYKRNIVSGTIANAFEMIHQGSFLLLIACKYLLLSPYNIVTTYTKAIEYLLSLGALTATLFGFTLFYFDQRLGHCTYDLYGNAVACATPFGPYSTLAYKLAISLLTNGVMAYSLWSSWK